MDRSRYAQTVREVVRHLLTTMRLSDVRAAWRKSKGKRVRNIILNDRSETFGRIYRVGVWTGGLADVPRSGPGSTLAATELLRRELPALLDMIGCETLLDVGCGDQAWAGHLSIRQKYIGVDIVPELIDDNRRLFPEREFHCVDAVMDDLPAGDTVLCREVLFHLSLQDGVSLLRNLARKPRRYLIATTDTVTLFNADVRSGDFRFLNLRKRPFRLPKPDFAIADDKVLPGRQLAAWRFDRLPL